MKFFCVRFDWGRGAYMLVVCYKQARFKTDLPNCTDLNRCNPFFPLQITAILMQDHFLFLEAFPVTMSINLALVLEQYSI